MSTSQSRESTTRKNAINCYDLDKINDQSNSRNLSLTDVEYLCAASESLSLIKLMNSCDLIKGGELLVSPLPHVWYAFQAFLGCFILCSDVPKVKNFICSHPDPLIWFTRFPK